MCSKNSKGKKKTQPRILYIAKLSFKNESEIKIFADKQKMREFVAGGLTLKKY